MTINKATKRLNSRAMEDRASPREVMHWVLRALRSEHISGIGEWLTTVPADFRSIKHVTDSFTVDDIPEDQLQSSIVLTLNSGQHFRLFIEEK